MIKTSRIFVTGDKHGDYYNLFEQMDKLQITKEDVIIILGDHGTLYYGPDRDEYKKRMLSHFPCTFILIRGNHDARPSRETYKHVLEPVSTAAYSGEFWRDVKYPNILYTREYGWYRFGDKDVFVIGGAYSVDKYYRLEMQDKGFKDYKWFNDEQLSNHEKQMADVIMLSSIDMLNPHIFMSHTCPMKYKPIDKLIPNIDQSKVDDSMERWLDVIEDSVNYEKWYCGHWHVDRTIDKIRFMYDDLELFDEISETIRSNTID